MPDKKDHTMRFLLIYGGTTMLYLTHFPQKHIPWNKGKLIGQKPPLKLKEIWAIRIHLQIANRIRDLALFNLAIDSKLRGCDLVKLKLRDVAHGNHIAKRTMLLQQKTQDRKSTRLNSSHTDISRMPSSA